MVFFNMVVACTWDFESDDRFKFKALERERDVECNEWKAECTLKLKELVAEARLQFKWQFSQAAAAIQDKPFAECLTPRNLAHRPLYWVTSSFL